MPKKTKRQKMLSEERRQKILLQFGQTRQTQNRVVTATTVKTDNVTLAPTYFASDLKKSLLFIAIVITLEIVVYFGTINGY